ncbi:hypothetical protein ACI8AF_17940, partial [Blastococcus sp. SYSU D00669]
MAENTCPDNRSAGSTVGISPSASLADQPDVVVDVEVLPVEAEHPADDGLLDARGAHRATPDSFRSTLVPRCDA